MLFFVPNIDLITYALACATVSLGGLAVTVIQSIFYLRSFPAKS